MKSLLCILMLLLSLSFTVSTAVAADDQPAVVDVSDAAPAVETVETESADSAVVVSDNTEDNASEEPAASVEKTAAVQTASWGEIKRIFKDQ